VYRSALQAAEASHFTQPSASQRLRELEDTMGVQRFPRHARGVEPTWHREVLVRHATSAVAGPRRACGEVSAQKSARSGQAAIVTVATAATDLMP
jgi:DNA-binding transcriptional LysR family regulator